MPVNRMSRPRPAERPAGSRAEDSAPFRVVVRTSATWFASARSGARAAPVHRGIRARGPVDGARRGTGMTLVPSGPSKCGAGQPRQETPSRWATRSTCCIASSRGCAEIDTGLALEDFSGHRDPFDQRAADHGQRGGSDSVVAGVAGRRYGTPWSHRLSSPSPGGPIPNSSWSPPPFVRDLDVRPRHPRQRRRDGVTREPTTATGRRAVLRRVGVALAHGA